MTWHSVAISSSFQTIAFQAWKRRLPGHLSLSRNCTNALPSSGRTTRFSRLDWLPQMWQKLSCWQPKNRRHKAVSFFLFKTDEGCCGLYPSHAGWTPAEGVTHYGYTDGK